MNETQIGQLVIDLKTKTEALEKGLETAKKKLQEIENENKNVENSNKGLESSWLGVAATATVALTGIISSIKSATEEYKAHTQAMSSLQNVADYTGESMDDLSSIMDKYEGIMTKSDLATTIKNFTLMGMSAKETEKMIEALTNSAIRNRNANYTVSEAVRVASEGYRQGLSTLSDSAGVTENLSVMLDNYARSIGKTASQLTEEEKNQAYLNRTMAAAEPFAGAMADYLDSLAGKQGEYSQAMRETQVAYSEALEPTLIKITEMKTNLIKLLGSLINSNNSATVGLTAFIVTILTFTLVLTAGMKVVQMYKKSIDALNISSKTLKVTLAGMFVTSIIVAGITAITNAYQKNKEKLEELRIEQEKYRDVLNDTIEFQPDNIDYMKNTKDSIEKYLEELKEVEHIRNSIASVVDAKENTKDMGASNEAIEKFDTVINELQSKNQVLTAEVRKQSDNFKELFDIQKDTLLGYDDLNDILKVYTQRVNEANIVEDTSNALNIEKTKSMQENAAQLKNNVSQMQNYLNIVKNGDKTTTEYQNAVSALAKAYPEASSAGGILIPVLEGIINAEQLQADEAWKASQDFINAQIANINIALESERVQKEVAQNVGKSWEEIAPSLQSILALLQTMAGYAPTDVPNITPVTPKIRSSSSSSYSNKRLDNYKKEIEHKKAMDQISLQQEISMYETALKSYAKTTDEKRELREKIYELNKELANKEKEILDQQTEDYESYIEEQKNLRGAEYDIKEQTRDYDKIISMHRNYLNQIMKDERLSLDERKEIYREELATIRDYEQQKRDLRVEAVDNTVSQLTNAITKQLEELQEKDKELIDENIKAVEEWKNARIKAINEEYDARIEAIEKELDALDRAEEEKTREEEDAEYEKKRNRLQELIDFEHDATTKANYQKELDKLVAEYQKTLDERALQDKKDALNEQKNLLQQEQDNQIQAIEDEADKRTEEYEKQLEELEKYYEEQMNMAQETAEKMLLNVQTNQDQILDLLKKYGDKYEITGQTLGEKLAQGINEGIANKIQSIIQKIQDTIDANLEAKIREWTSSNYKYEADYDKPKTSTINVTQNNYIENTPEMPSETYRKFNNTTQKLAEELAGI